MQNVLFTNTRKDTTFELSKRVTGGMGERNKDFEFEIYIIDEGRELSGNVNAVKTELVNGVPTDRNTTLNFVDGSARVQLKHGEKVVLSGLPVGARFETEEIASSRAQYEYSANMENGVLDDDGTAVQYMNNKESVMPTGMDDVSQMRLILLMLIGLLFALWARRQRKNIA